MKRFHGGNSTGGFSALLRSMSKNKSIQMPANNLQAGAKPEMGGSTQRRPDDKATQKHMDARDKSGSRNGRRGSGAHDAPKRAPIMDPEHRIARGSAGTEGRMIHHETHVKQEHGVPAHHAIGANRTKFKKGRVGMFKKSSGMSPEMEGHESVPGHQSVINRGPVPHGGYRHGKMPSRTRVSNLAKKLSFHTSIH